MYDLFEKAVMCLRVFKVIMISNIITASPYYVHLFRIEETIPAKPYGGALIHYKFRKILDFKQ